MEIKYILTNIILISILYYAFKLFDREYSYCRTYTFGYIIGFISVYLMPMAIFDIGYFVDVSWKLVLFSFNLIGLGFVISWHGFMAYNKEKIKNEGVCPNPTLVANPKMFKTIVYSYFIMTIIATLIVLFL